MCILCKIGKSTGYRVELVFDFTGKVPTFIFADDAKREVLLGMVSIKSKYYMKFIQL